MTPDFMPFTPLVADILRALGVLGAVLYVSAFAALQLGWISGQGRAYTLWTMLAAFLMLLSLSVDFNAGSAFIQITWLMIGCARLLSGAFFARVPTQA